MLLYAIFFDTSCGKNIKENKRDDERAAKEIVAMVKSGKQRGRGGGVERRMRSSHAKGRERTDVSIWKERDW